MFYNLRELNKFEKFNFEFETYSVIVKSERGRILCVNERTGKYRDFDEDTAVYVNQKSQVKVSKDIRYLDLQEPVSD